MPLLKEGAEQLSKDPSCPKIIIGDVSTKKWPKSNPMFFYTCERDGQLFTVNRKKSQIEATRKTGGTSFVPTPIDANIAISSCKKFIKSSATVPSSVETSFFDTGTHAYPNGNLRVTMGFSAKNAFGGEGKYYANCLVLPNGKLEGNISEK